MVEDKRGPQNRLIAISGGPGAGKTATLGRLASRGYTVVPEVARGIIADRKAQGLNPRPEPSEFAQAIFEQDVAQYEAAATTSGIKFFDRSIVDSLGMLFGLGLLSESQRNTAAVRYPYNSQVFIFPPWREIYRTDSERDQSYEESVSVHESVCRCLLYTSDAADESSRV